MPDHEKRVPTETVRIRIPLPFRKTAAEAAFIKLGGEEEEAPPLVARPVVGSLLSRDTLSRQLLDNIYDGLIITDLQGTVVDANARAAALLDCPHDDLLDRPVTDFIDGGDESLVTQILQNIDEGSFTLIECFCIRRDAVEFPAEVTVNILQMEERDLLCFFLRDITKRMQLETDLLRLSKAVESAGDGISIMDAFGNHIYQNAAFSNLTGYSFQQIGDMGGTTRLYAEPGAPEQILEAVSTAGAWSGELTLRSASSAAVPVDVRVNAIKDEDGDVIGLICVHADMTERKRAELKLRRAHDELERRVEARTAELRRSNRRLQKEVTERRRAEEELTRYATELERSNQDLEQFANVTSHDLQEPLRAIISYMQLLDRRYKGQLGEDADRFIGRAVDAGKRMQNLVKALLEYARVGTQDRSFIACDCNAILDDVIENLQVAIAESGAVIDRDDLPVVTADDALLEQLLQNLVANAIKFRGEATPHVKVSATRIEEIGYRLDRSSRTPEQLQADHGWLFAVEDNGIGIDRQFQDRVFRIFQRLHSIRDYPGTGIGLALCRRIVEHHGGEIWVDSTPGGGATFWFVIPDSPEAERNTGPAPERPHHPNNRPAPLSQ